MNDSRGAAIFFVVAHGGAAMSEHSATTSGQALATEYAALTSMPPTATSKVLGSGSPFVVGLEPSTGGAMCRGHRGAANAR